MTAERRIYARPYFFEIFTLANFLLLLLFVARGPGMVLSTLPRTAGSFGLTLLGYACLGVVIRLLVAARRGNARRYLMRIRTPGWLTDLVRMILLAGLLAHTYAWIKLMVPLAHPRLYDQELWDLDQAMFFGLSPNILFINLFSQPLVMRGIDWSYARIFFASMTMAFGFFLSEPSRRLRVAFTNGNTLMWIGGAWLYLLIPSVGPGYRFPDLWMPLASAMPITLASQALLMRNYQNLLQLMRGVPVEVQLMLGIGAFPSLHVAFQTFAFLWMRRIWISGQVVFGVFVLVIVIGSVVTGWHYLIDGVAGIILAAFSYWLPARLLRVRRWLALRHGMRQSGSPV